MLVMVVPPSKVPGKSASRVDGWARPGEVGGTWDPAARAGVGRVSRRREAEGGGWFVRWSARDPQVQGFQPGAGAAPFETGEGEAAGPGDQHCQPQLSRSTLTARRARSLD